jgi:hypothetical protein
MTKRKREQSRTLLLRAVVMTRDETRASRDQTNVVVVVASKFAGRIMEQ